MRHAPAPVRLVHRPQAGLRVQAGGAQAQVHSLSLPDWSSWPLTLGLAAARPSTALLNAVQGEKRALEEVILRLKRASSQERIRTLDSISVVDDQVRLSQGSSTADVPAEKGKSQAERSHATDDEGGDHLSDEELDVRPFLSVDERGKVDSFGPSSALQGPSRPVFSAELPVTEHVRNQLIANAVLQRQREHELRRLSDIDGVPVDLAMHLLDLHWNRQHHTFLLTYRPAIMRDLIDGGPYCSKFLINAIFACASKYSQRIEVRDDPMDPKSAGRRFFLRCDQLLSEESLLSCSSIPTLVGLLLLGSTHNARGETSKGWLYTGYALRMVYDLGLHLDGKQTVHNAEEIEIRRRVFWGAFICDKLQSLYIGRPVAINLRDAHVSRNFMDTIEEKELWTPCIDPMFPSDASASIHWNPTPIRSVSTFQQLCLLSKIMTKIINRFYVVGATAANARASLQSIDDALTAWNENLPADLRYQPWADNNNNNNNNGVLPPRVPPPNLMILHATYHSLIILLHRPFISDGHLRSAAPPASSWRRCSAAARHITSIVLAYRSAYGLRGAPYLIGYAVYVACTIHVRNAAAAEGSQGGENSSLLAAGLRCLDELAVPNAGVARPASIIRKLSAASRLNLACGV